MDITGIGTVADAAKSILGMIFPDKTEAEKSQLAAALALVQAQTDIDRAEAQSPDKLQHWRGGMGWTCVAGYAYNFIIRPLAEMITSLLGHHVDLVSMDLTELSVITAGMLGLGGLHVAERINGK